MNFIDLIRVSCRQIVRYRRHYYGIILAITLGIAGLQTVILVSRDFKKNLNRDLTMVGGVTVVKAYFDNQLTQRPMEFQPRTLEALRSLPGVEAVSTIAFRAGKTSRGQIPIINFPVIALDEFFWQVRGFWTTTGRLFGREAVAGRKRECVLGASLAEKIFGHRDIAGLTVEIYSEPYRVTGVLGGIIDPGLAKSAFLPITTVQDRFPGRNLADRIYLRCLTVEDVIPVATSIADMVQKYQATDHLYIEFLAEGLKRVEQLFWWGEFFTYLTIGLTLVFGGLGIWNVLNAAVRSRTREIGLKKALGAEDADVLKEFFAEAVILSLGASFLGIILGWVTVACLANVVDCQPPTQLLFLCMGLELVFGIFLGIVAGHFPAKHASRLEVVAAMSYE